MTQMSSDLSRNVIVISIDDKSEIVTLRVLLPVEELLSIVKLLVKAEAKSLVVLQYESSKIRVCIIRHSRIKMFAH